MKIQNSQKLKDIEEALLVIEQRKALKAVRESQLELLQYWRDIHG